MKCLNKKRLNKSQMYLLEKGEFTCADLKKLVGQYFDRELPRALQSRVQEHIECCSECVQYAGSYHLVIELAREIGLERNSTSQPITILDETGPVGAGLPAPIRSRLVAHLNRTLGLSLPS